MLRTAIILAGGFGTRLQSVVSDVPKPMAPVNGEPFLNYQLRYLKHYGITKVILAVGHLSDKIKNYYKENFEGIEISYSTELSPLGTGGAIRLALEMCDEDEILVLNGDSFFDVPLNKFYNSHKNKSSQISLALRGVDDASRYGSIETDKKNRIISFKEKESISWPGVINAGTYILNKKLFLEYTEPELNFGIEKDFFQKYTSELVMMGFHTDGYFIDIGIPEDYKKAQDDQKAFKYR